MAEHLKENHRPLGVLFSELSSGMSRLFRDEVELARAELTQKASHLVKNFIFLIIGGLVGYAAFLWFLAAAVFGLATVVPLWLSALLMGLAVSGAAFTLIQKGLSDLKRTQIKPEKTIRSVKEDIKWAKEQI